MPFLPPGRYAGATASGVPLTCPSITIVARISGEPPGITMSSVVPKKPSAPAVTPAAALLAVQLPVTRIDPIWTSAFKGLPSAS